jgi:hypothetical protein
LAIIFSDTYRWTFAKKVKKPTVFEIFAFLCLIIIKENQLCLNATFGVQSAPYTGFQRNYREYMETLVKSQCAFDRIIASLVM